MRISDWSSDVCSSDLVVGDAGALHAARGPSTSLWLVPLPRWGRICGAGGGGERSIGKLDVRQPIGELQRGLKPIREAGLVAVAADEAVDHHLDVALQLIVRSEERSVRKECVRRCRLRLTRNH